MLDGAISSSPVLLRCRVTIEYLHDDGNCPVVSDTLNKFVIYSARVSISSFSNHIGSGSEAHGFDGDDLTAFTTLSPITVLKDDNPGEWSHIYEHWQIS